MYTINIIQYYFNLVWTWIADYVTYLYDNFREFAPVIKIAAISLTFSLLLIVFTLIRIMLRGLRNRKSRKYQKRIRERYGDAMKYILSEEADPKMTRKQIIEKLELDENDKENAKLLKNDKERLAFCRVLYRYRISDDAALGRRGNLHVLLDIFDLPQFLENTVNKGSLKLKAEVLIMLRAFKLPVNQWIANQLLNSRRLRLRRLAMYASIMSSSNTDLEYFESDFFDDHCCTYDEIQLGYVLERRKSMRRKIPNLAQLAALQKNPGTQAVFVRLMHQFEQKEYCADLEELFSRGNKELMHEICRTWGYLGYTEGEQILQDVIMTQSDDTKVAIMHALTRLNTGKSLNVIVDGYRNSGDPHVRYEALRCLYSYGPEGRRKFEELKLEAPEHEKMFFEFFTNPLTRKEALLSEENTYEALEGANVFSVN